MVQNVHVKNRWVARAGFAEVGGGARPIDREARAPQSLQTARATSTRMPDAARRAARAPRCAWLNHSDRPQRFIRLVERYGNVRLWFSGHFHLAQNYPDR